MKYNVLFTFLILLPSAFTFTQSDIHLKKKLLSHNEKGVSKWGKSQSIYPLAFAPEETMPSVQKNKSDSILYYFFPAFFSSDFFANSMDVYVKIVLDGNENIHEVFIDLNLDKLFLSNEEIHFNEKGICEINIICYNKKFRYFLEMKDANLVKSKTIGGLLVKPLFYFEGEFMADSVLHKVLLKNNLLGTKIKLDSIHISEKRLSTVMLDEPFQINNKYYKFTNFNPLNNILSVVYLGDEYKPLGYRENYFVDVDILQDHIHTQLKDNKDFVLLYFWANWCVPCLKKMDYTLTINEYINDSTYGQMIFSPLIVSDSDRGKTEKYIEENLVETYQEFIEFHEDCDKMFGFIDDCSIIQLLKVSSLPTYILIDNEGKIIHRSEGISNDVLQIVKQNFPATKS